MKKESLNHSRSNENKNHSHIYSCPQCASTNLSTGAGLKPGQMSLKCSECKAFVGYKNLEKLKPLRRQKRLTSCLELMEKQGISGDAAIFTLALLGGQADV